MNPGFLLVGLLSALLFGVATPLCKLLLGPLSQFQLAGLLYLGAGLSMVPFAAAARRKARVRRKDARSFVRLAAAVLFGGCLGPVLLLAGLSAARASSVSLWLNLELAATAVLGALFFRDHLDGRAAIGAAGALAAGVLVTLGEGPAGIVPSLLVAAACLCWALDNNLTALIDGITPQETTLVKGIVAGAVNLGIGIAAAGAAPPIETGFAALGLGAACYGGSIVLYITAAQQIGASRAQVLFASAPVFGLGLSVFLLGDRVGWQQVAAVALIAGSILLMRRAGHGHAHRHAASTHIHLHRHDDFHHDHAHESEHEGDPEPSVHSHEHVHASAEHEHVHVPDLHHRHRHGSGR
jgi:drug/metabolite transporter (DMT)-like permease